MDQLVRTPAPSLLPRAGAPAVEWRRSEALVPYPDALSEMDRVVSGIVSGGPERVWLVEHPPLYTAGTSADPTDLLDPDLLPVYPAGRGGQYTYHGPGQRVAYVMLDLRRREPDVRAYVRTLEEWLIQSLAAFGVLGERRRDRVGVWVRRPDKGAEAEDKIAAIGIRLRHWVSFHGVALNVAPDLSHYSGIIPCGVRQHGVTSLRDLGVSTTMDEVDTVLRSTFEALFGTTIG